MFACRQVKSRRCSPSVLAVSMSLGAAVTAPQPAPRPPALDRPIPTDFKLTHDERVLLNSAKYRDWRDKPEAYLRSPAHRARPNLTTPEGLWGSAVPMWAFSTYHLIRRPSREQALGLNPKCAQPAQSRRLREERRLRDAPSARNSRDSRECGVNKII